MNEPSNRTVHRLDGRGQIRDWLISPTWRWRCPTADLAELLAADGDPFRPAGRWVLTNGPDVAPLKQRLYERHPLDTDQRPAEPIEGGELTWRTHDGTQRSGNWSRLHTGADGLVDASRFCYTPEYSEVLAAAVVEVDQAEWRDIEVACTGPFGLWVNGQLVGGGTMFTYMEPAVQRFSHRFTSGLTTLHLASWQVAFREVRQVARIRVLGLPVQVVVPSPGADQYVAAIGEQVLESLAVAPWALADDSVTLTGPAGAALRVTVDDGQPVQVRLDEAGRAEIAVTPSSVETVAAADGETGDVTASMLTTGERVLTVGIDDPASPVTRRLAVGVLPPRHRLTPRGNDPQTWRTEVLDHVAHTAPSTARALARFARDPATLVTPVDLQQALAMIDARGDCADFEAVGVLNLWHRVPAAQWAAGTREAVGASLLGFKYWIDQPGLDAMCYFTENHQFVWHTAELLAGEAFADETFGNTGWTGRQHADHGSELAREWLTRKLQGGFSEFDSNAYLAIDSLALASLVEYAADPDVRAMAEAVLDKVLLSLAGNSWRGVHGSAHGRSYTPTLRSSRFEETAPIMWALWGTGTLNNAVLPVTVLTTAARYQVPAIIAAIAGQPAERWDGRQSYRGSYRRQHDLLERPYGSDVTIHRTPDAMLSCVADYRSGLPGLQEHIWGATLGAEVQVFATYPSTDSISPSARPNAWAGQRILPRARQFGDTVLAVFARPVDDPESGTHLWFPAPLMDEVVQRGSWLTGRVGDGYVAVAADGGFTQISAGDEAGQAFVPIGGGRGYVCTVGRRAVDGDFAAFVESLAEPEFREQSAADAAEPTICWQTRDGRRLQLSWRRTPTVDGRSVDLDADGRPVRQAHLDNPACVSRFGDDELLASWAGERLRLDLRHGRRLEPASGAGLTSGVDGAST